MMSASIPISEFLPICLKSIKDLVALQHGSVNVACPMAFYKRASGQVPACRTMLSRRGVRLMSQDLREHLMTSHHEDLKIIKNLVEDLFMMECEDPDHASSMPCPLKGCMHRVVLLMPTANVTTEAPIPEGDVVNVTSTATGKGNYLTGSTLTQKGHSQKHVPLPSTSLAMEFALHVVSEHLLELQALAALMDSLTLRAYTRNMCPFHILGPKACMGVHSTFASPPKMSDQAKQLQHPERKAISSASGTSGGTKVDTQTRENSDGVKQASPHLIHSSPTHPPSHTPSLSPTARLFLSSGRRSSTSSSQAGSEVGTRGHSTSHNHHSTPLAPSSNVAGVAENIALEGQVDWWDHLHLHLRDCVATVGDILTRCNEAAEAADDALSPRVFCDVSGCTVYFQNAIDLACHMFNHLKPKHPRLDESLSLLVLNGSSLKGKGSSEQQHSRRGRESYAEKKGDGGSSTGANLSCPFILTSEPGSRQADGDSRPCTFHTASQDVLEAHVLEEHSFDVQALSEALAQVGKYHHQTHTYVCPVRCVPLLPLSITSGHPPHGGGGGGTSTTHRPLHGHERDAGQHGNAFFDPHAENGNLCWSARELSRHLQVHHLLDHCVLAAFSGGLHQDGSAHGSESQSSQRDYSSAYASSTTTSNLARCLICEEAVMKLGASRVAAEGAATNGNIPNQASGKALSKTRIAGPAHMLHHLGLVHPRQLLQLLHTASLLADVHSSNGSSLPCPFGGCSYSTGTGRNLQGRQALRMHLARHHAARMLLMCHMAGAEAPLPASLTWGAEEAAKSNIMSAISAQSGVAGTGSWGTMEKGMQTQIVSGPFSRSAHLGKLAGLRPHKNADNHGQTEIEHGDTAGTRGAAPHSHTGAPPAPGSIDKVGELTKRMAALGVVLTEEQLAVALSAWDFKGSHDHDDKDKTTDTMPQHHDYEGASSAPHTDQTADTMPQHHDYEGASSAPHTDQTADTMPQHHDYEGASSAPHTDQTADTMPQHHDYEGASSAPHTDQTADTMTQHHDQSIDHGHGHGRDHDATSTPVAPDNTVGSHLPAVPEVRAENEGPVAAAATKDQNPVAAAATKDQNPVAAASTKDQNPVAAAATKDQNPVAAASTNDQNPVAAASTKDQNPVAAASTKDQNPVAAAATKDQNPVAAASTKDQDPVAAASTKDQDPAVAAAPNPLSDTPPDLEDLVPIDQREPCRKC
ncbi:hypothetical protein CEUSTIGMA_g10556.t1 [Chlamydomonas eustigma]|uniref:C2H2-type domain-containing protein n=1 Tax=Chlamydomonas eustigma TaxID=1157962 RepID=A0A250XK00_9CHLO|nr:hypothetical protein CEUSTIGMA_g10556.t1 [Chlamydomonas eustigma]|eukprot:GAX83130.1 hypothetical protein CEUSTIGMA_g10556.t1 [Chlamydomonas eustigma]